MSLSHLVSSFLPFSKLLFLQSHLPTFICLLSFSNSSQRHLNTGYYAFAQSDSSSSSSSLENDNILNSNIDDMNNAAAKDISDDGCVDRYRPDGVRINYDPYAPGVAERYGLPGGTDSEGFNPYADTVGPGIYGGSVKRDENGNVVIGKQYQNHNPTPGPLYDGTGYSLMSRAIHSSPSKVQSLLTTYPQLVSEISTGGATPLHVCGMSLEGQRSTQILVDEGADINVIDSYGYNALHRMCSNNLALGAEVLVTAGLDPHGRKGNEESPVDVAKSSRAVDVLHMFQRLGYL